jgi:hypothetical protein
MFPQPSVEYYFCKDPDCPTVYYGADGQTLLGEADLRETVVWET